MSIRIISTGSDHLVRQIDGVLDLDWVHKQSQREFCNTIHPRATATRTFPEVAFGPLSDSCTTAKFGSLCGAFDAHLDFAVESLEVDWYGQQP